jgi:hypothetical protein
MDGDPRFNGREPAFQRARTRGSTVGRCCAGGGGVIAGGIIGAMGTTVERLLPPDDGVGEALLELTREIATRELAPQVHDAEERGEFPEAAYRLLGRSGLLALPFREEYGGGAQPYETYLQVVEEIATAWPSVGVGMSVHCLTVNVVETNGSDELREKWLPLMLGGSWLGAYCLSEPQAGSDVSGIRTRAVRDGDEYVATGRAPTTTSCSPARPTTPNAGCRPSCCPATSTA